MKRIKKLTQIFLISIFLSSCSSSINQESPVNNLEENINANSSITVKINTKVLVDEKL